MRTVACLALAACAATACHSEPAARAAARGSDRAQSPAINTSTSTSVAGARVRALVDRLGALAVHQAVALDPELPEARRDHTAPSLTARPGATPLELPLAHTSVVAEVTGNIARVEVTQLYQNPSAERLEATYAFPLPENAAVTDMLFRIGDRVVMSQVRRRQEAKREYEAAKAAGHTAALTEQERPNLFTQSVANIPPGESVEVVLRYIHEVKLDDGRYLFHFPTTVGPRYVPAHGVADAARVTPPVLAPGVRTTHELDIVVALGPGDAFADLASKSHRLVSGVDGGRRLIALADDDRVPNKDFILSWRPAGREPEARALVERERGDDYLMLFVQPPVDVAPATVRPRELVFLIDRSGSMMGQPIETAKRLIARALEGLGPNDTFQLIAFDGAAEPMTPAPLASTPEHVREAVAWLSALRGGGGTEMLTGIKAALDTPADPARLRLVVFCTDGFIGNEREIIDYVGKARGGAHVLGFGIGSSVNRFLLEGVARAGHGAAEIVRQDEPVDEAVARLYRRIDRPLLTELALDFEGVSASELEPATLPDLFAGQPLVVVAKARVTGTAAVTLRGRLGGQRWSRRLPLAIAPAATGPSARTPVLGTLWARRRVEAIEDGHEYGQLAAADQEKIVALGLGFKLITPYTSFVAVERRLKVDTRIPLAELAVPNALPEGVSADGIFAAGEGTVSAELSPVRVKPGDPELRVRAPADARVRVELPFGGLPLAAVYDAASGEHVARFLVPSGWPDGTWYARVIVERADGSRVELVRELHVDTRPAAIAVVGQPDAVRAGAAFTIALKPALPLGEVAALAGEHGAAGLGDALKSAMDVKEVLVRAPWGEIVRAELPAPGDGAAGAFGVYRATLHAPRDLGALGSGPVRLEIVACDSAGNVGRRELTIGGDRHAALAWAGAFLGFALIGCALMRRSRS